MANSWSKIVYAPTEDKYQAALLDGTVDENDIIILGEEQELLFIPEDNLAPVNISSRIKRYESFEEANAALVSDDRLYPGQLIAIKDDQLYKICTIQKINGILVIEDRIEDVVKALNLDISNIKSKLDENIEDLKNTNQSLSALDKRVESEETKSVELEIHIDNIEESLQTVNDDIDSITSEIKNIKEDSVDKDSIYQIKDDIDKLKISQSDLSGALEGMKNNIDNIQLQVDKIDGIENNIISIQDSIQGLNDKVDGNVISIRENTEKIFENEKNINLLDHKLTEKNYVVWKDYLGDVEVDEE